MRKSKFDKALFIAVPTLLVFHYLHGVQKKPLQVNIDAIYALNFSHHYLGVILDNNGQGFDFQYPHKTSVVKARLHELLGEDTFAKIQSNVAATA